MTEKQVDNLMFDFLFSEHTNLEEIWVDDVVMKALSDENVLLVMTKKMVETEN